MNQVKTTGAKAETSLDPKRAIAIRILALLSKLIPGDYLKTTLFLYGVSMPRKALRLAINRFYRMEHVYDVLKEAKGQYKGNFSILEFGTHEGYALTKMLYATRYLGMDSRVTVHGFDSFEGMPAPQEGGDQNVVYPGVDWAEGQFSSSFESLNEYCRERYSNYRLHKGYFEDTLTDEFLKELKTRVPILVWVDCDFYSSARTVFERLLPVIPNGCVIYFDEYEWNYGTRFVGESKLVHEVNHGVFGDDIELVLDTGLSLDSKRVYRFVRSVGGRHYERLSPYVPDAGRRRGDGSPFP